MISVAEWYFDDIICLTRGLVSQSICALLHKVLLKNNSFKIVMSKTSVIKLKKGQKKTLHLLHLPALQVPNLIKYNITDIDNIDVFWYMLAYNHADCNQMWLSCYVKKCFLPKSFRMCVTTSQMPIHSVKWECLHSINYSNPCPISYGGKLFCC